MTLVGAPTGVSLYLGDEVPTRRQRPHRRWPPATTDGRAGGDPEDGTSGRYLTVWLTSLPAVPGGFRGEVAEVVVRA